MKLHSSSKTLAGKVIRPAPTLIEHKSMRFLITHQPQDTTIKNYLKMLKENEVTHLVCTTNPTYHVDNLTGTGVNFTKLSFVEGSAPTQEIVEKWFHLLQCERENNSEMCVGVHCVSGLGRAPLLVALALIELGMKYEDAVDLIRSKRRGALKKKQLQFLAKYKRRKHFKKKSSTCLIHCIPPEEVAFDQRPTNKLPRASYTIPGRCQVEILTECK